MNRHRAQRFGTIAGGARARRLALALIVAAAPFPGAAPVGPAGGDPPVAAAASFAFGDDDRIGTGAGPGTRGFDPGPARALPAKQLRVGGPQRTLHAPLPFATLPGIDAPPRPLRTGWLAAGDDARGGRAAHGSAGIRAPPGSAA